MYPSVARAIAIAGIAVALSGCYFQEDRAVPAYQPSAVYAAPPPPYATVIVRP